MPVVSYWNVEGWEGDPQTLDYVLFTYGLNGGHLTFRIKPYIVNTDTYWLAGQRPNELVLNFSVGTSREIAITVLDTAANTLGSNTVTNSGSFSVTVSLDFYSDDIDYIKIYIDDLTDYTDDITLASIDTVFGVTLTAAMGAHEVLYGTTAWALHEASCYSYDEVVQAHESLFGTTGCSLHVAAYHGSREVLAAQDVVYGVTSSALLESRYQSDLRIHTQSLHEAQWRSLGTDSSLGLHESIYHFEALEVSFALHDALWTWSANIYNLHTADWQSVVPCMNLHQSAYHAIDNSVVCSAHESIYRSYQITPIIHSTLIYARI